MAKKRKTGVEALEREIENLRRAGDGPLNPRRLRAKGAPANWREYEQWLLEQAKKTPKATAALMEARTALGVFRQKAARRAGGAVRITEGQLPPSGARAARGPVPYKSPLSPGSEMVHMTKLLGGATVPASVKGGIPSMATAAAKPTSLLGKGKGAILPLLMMLIGGGIGRATGGGDAGEGQLPPHLQAQMAIAAMQSQGGGQQKTNTDMINAMRVINMLKQLQEMAAATQIAPPAGLV